MRSKSKQIRLVNSSQYFYEETTKEHYLIPYKGNVFCLVENNKPTRDEYELIKQLKKNNWTFIRNFGEQSNKNDVYDYCDALIYIVGLDGSKIMLHGQKGEVQKLVLYAGKIPESKINLITNLDTNRF